MSHDPEAPPVVCLLHLLDLGSKKTEIIAVNNRENSLMCSANIPLLRRQCKNARGSILALFASLYGGPTAFLLSKHYLVAMVCGLVEYAIEGFFVPDLKAQMLVSYAGLALVVLGETIRKSAILTAKQNFTHDIKMYHRENHELVSHGVYRLVRHPSYLGFFVWSIGTQILLVNPVCTVAYAIVTWRYFAQRIKFEEYFLRQFFGKQYSDYAKRVHSGIPFVE